MSRSTRFFLCAVFSAVAIDALVGAPANASFISMSPDPILGGNLVSTGAPIASPFGYVTFNIANVNEISTNISGGNEFITYTASPILTFFSDPLLTNVLTSATFQGQFEIEVFGRSTAFQPGTFSFQFLSSTASGAVMGTPVSVQLNPDPALISGGTTTITAGPGVGQFTIDTNAVQYSQFSVNGGPFSNLPPIQLVGVSAVPEPGSLTLLATAVVGLGLAYRRFA